MNILFVHECFGAFGGAEANVLATATALKERGHNVGILHGPRTGKSETAWMSAFSSNYPFDSANSPSSVREATQTFQPDVIYLHKLADLPALEALTDSGTPIVRMVHDHDLYCMRSYKYNVFSRQICDRSFSPFCIFPCGASVARNRTGGLPIKWVSYSAKSRELEINRKFHRLVVATQFMKAELLRNRFDSNKISVHAPVPPRGDSGWASSFSDKNYIIYAGQIIRGKGVDVLLEALARVRVPFTCMIFGDGEHREHCERLSRRLGLAERVHFKGFVSAEEMRPYYSQSTLAVVSSVWPEPFGAVGLEAMRFGLPVVAFDAGGIREWLLNGENGFLVPWMDRSAFARRVEELMGDKALARHMGQRGRRLVTEQFEFSDYINRIEKLFLATAEQALVATAA